MGRMKTSFRFILAVCLIGSYAFAQDKEESSHPVSDSSVENLPAIEAKGLLKPFREVRLASRSQGVIRMIKEEGTQVKEGEAVLVLEDAAEKLEVEKQKQVLEMRAFEGDAGKALDSTGAISKIEGKEKAINHEVAKLLLAEAVEMLNRRSVYAPFPGVITERLREVGEAVDEFVPVMTMMDINRLYFEVYLPSDRIRDVAEGQRAEVKIDSFPERTFPGTVRLVSPVVNAASSEFKVKIEVENSDGRLSSGLSGMCRIFTRSSASVPTQSDSASTP